MAKTPGSLWVESTELHYVDVAGNEWRIQGDYWGPSNPAGYGANQGVPGSVWIEGDAYLHYVGEGGADWRVPLQLTHNDAANQTGGASIWVEGNYLFHAIGGGKYWEHGDYVHSDGASHTDVPHSDGHADGTHGDSHGDGHTDSGHGDSHTDASHGDTTQSHSDGHSDSFTVAPPAQTHQDGTYKWWGDPPAYAAGTHTDLHYDNNNYTSETAHNDTHFDSADHVDGSHGDIHSDSAHGDGHNDSPHSDGAHGDGHYDSPHQDASGGGGSQHWDEPAYIGP